MASLKMPVRLVGVLHPWRGGLHFAFARQATARRRRAPGGAPKRLRNALLNAASDS